MQGGTKRRWAWLGLCFAWACNEAPPPAAPVSAPASAKTAGRLSVASDPGGAAVLVDGVPGCAPTPCEIEGVSFGPHELRLQHPDFEDFTRGVKTSTDPATVEIALSTEGKKRLPGTVTLRFEGERPPKRKGQLQIFAAETEIALSNDLSFSLLSGKRVFEVRRVGFAPVSREVELPPGGTVEVVFSADDWKEDKISLSVDSGPVKGKVTIDGKSVGTAPVSVPELGAASAHAVKVSAEGFAEYATTVRWKPGGPRELSLNVTLEKEAPGGFLKVTSSPLIGLTIYLNGKKTKYTTPVGGKGIPLAPGSYKIELESLTGRRFDGGSVEIKEGASESKSIRVK
jgi:hypothetical protein